MLSTKRFKQGSQTSIPTRLFLLAGTIACVLSADAHSDDLSLKDLIDTIQDRSVEQKTRLEAIDNLEILSISKADSERIVPVLYPLLEEKSAAVRIRAAYALYELDQPPTKLLAASVSALKDSDPENRVRAGHLLWRFQHQAAPAIEHIVAALTDVEPRVRSVAASALGDMGPDFKQISIPPLIRLLNDSDRSVRVAAAEALAMVDGPIEPVSEVFIDAIRADDMDKPDYSPFSTAYETVKIAGRLGSDGAPLVDVLNKTLKRGGTYRQTVAAKTLSEIGPTAVRAMDGLDMALRNGEAEGMPFVHQSWCASDEAANALAVIGVQAVPILIAALKDSHPRVRANAAQALGNIPAGTEASVPELVKLLNDRDAAVRSHAAWSLGKLGSTGLGRETFNKVADEMTMQLVKMLFDNTEWFSAPAFGGIAQNWSVPWHAVEAIARIKPNQRTLIASLEASLREKASVNFAVAATIASIGHEAKSLTAQLQPLLKEKTTRAHAAYAMAAVNPDFDGLDRVLETALVKEKKDWPELDEDRAVDRVAARGLGLLGRRAQSSIPRLKEAIRVAEESRFVGGASDIVVCCLAILQIARNDKEASRRLLEALDDCDGAYDSDELDAAAKAIPEYIADPTHPLRDMVIARLTHANSEVRLRSAAWLTAAGIEQRRTIAALTKIAREGRYRTRGAAIDLLAKHGAAAVEVTDLLTEFFPDREPYTIGGDFYGNGGAQYEISEKAGAALAAIGSGAVPALKRRLKDPLHVVRAAAAVSLGLMGQQAAPATDQLIQCTTDKSHHVRFASVVALGRIGSGQTSIDQDLLDALKRGSMDHRPSIRGASRAALQTLNQPARSRP